MNSIPGENWVQTALIYIVIPLMGTLIGGMVYWLRKLDDRQFSLQRELYEKFVTRDHLDLRFSELRDDIRTLTAKIDSHLLAVSRPPYQSGDGK